MKVNEAPEKIYILKHTDYSDRRILNAFIEKENNNDIEYVRADAFIEKAVDYIFNNMRCDGYTLQTKMKFIRDFKNYMKGE